MKGTLRLMTILIGFFTMMTGYSATRDSVAVERPRVAACNAPFIIGGLEQWNVNLSASFLYWIAQEDGLTVAALQHNPLPNPPPQSINYTHMNFGYDPGFRVSLGMDTGNCDDWTINADYTRLHSKHHASLSIPTIFFHAMRPNFLSVGIDFGIDPVNGYSFLRSHGEWENDIDLIDVSLRRPFCVSRKLVFSPFIGLRGGWLDQSYNGTYLATSLAHLTETFPLSSRSKQTTWVLGPRAGVSSSWLLGCGFNLFGNVAGSLLYQKFHNTFQDYDVNGPFSNTSEDKSVVTPNLELGLGVGYETCFANDARLNITLGYDFQIFWNQNRMSDLVANETLIIQPFFIDVGKTADLTLRGYTLTVKYAF